MVVPGLFFPEFKKKKKKKKERKLSKEIQRKPAKVLDIKVFKSVVSNPLTLKCLEGPRRCSEIILSPPSSERTKQREGKFCFAFVSTAHQ